MPITKVEIALARCKDEILLAEQAMVREKAEPIPSLPRYRSAKRNLTRSQSEHEYWLTRSEGRTDVTSLSLWDQAAIREGG